MIDLERIQRRITDEFGLAARHNWRKELADAINRICVHTLLTPAELQRRLDTDVSLLRDVAGQLGVNESYFFRQPEHFEFVMRHLQDRLVFGRDGSPVTIWSAGCGRGEEPYTTAILVDARLGSEARSRITLVASDVSRSAIEAAKAGVYTPWSFRSLPDSFPKCYFEFVSETDRRVVEQVRDWVRFVHLSVSEHLLHLPPRSIGVLFFRNVAVYLDPAKVAALYRSFAEVLAANGLLIVAPADPWPPSELFEPETCDGVFRVRSNTSGHAKMCEARPRPSSQPRLARAVKPMTSRELPHRDSHEALRLADEGKMEEALAMATKVVERTPTSASGYLLRGQIHLSAADNQKAVDDLRRVVFIAPNSMLGRYWYVVALRAVGMKGQCVGQLRELIRYARGADPKSVLDDQQTTVQELLAAATRLMKELS